MVEISSPFSPAAGSTQAHTGLVSTVATAHGKVVSGEAASDDPKIKLWQLDSTTLREIGAVSVPEALTGILSCDIMVDGRAALFLSADGGVVHWDLRADSVSFLDLSTHLDGDVTCMKQQETDLFVGSDSIAVFDLRMGSKPPKLRASLADAGCARSLDVAESKALFGAKAGLVGVTDFNADPPVTTTHKIHAAPVRTARYTSAGVVSAAGPRILSTLSLGASEAAWTQTMSTDVVALASTPRCRLTSCGTADGRVAVFDASSGTCVAQCKPYQGATWGLTHCLSTDTLVSCGDSAIHVFRPQAYVALSSPVL